jgi:hypothetical protein
MEYGRIEDKQPCFGTKEYNVRSPICIYCKDKKLCSEILIRKPKKKRKGK